MTVLFPAPKSRHFHNPPTITHTMQLDFNNLRLNLQRTHNELVELINQGYDWDCDQVLIPWEKVGELKNLMNDLRTAIATLMCAYTSEPETIDNISDQAQLHCLDFPEE